MSIFIPYSVSKVIEYFTITYGLDLTTLTSFEQLILTITANLYFFLFWSIICYFALKLFNRIYYRLF